MMNHTDHIAMETFVKPLRRPERLTVMLVDDDRLIHEIMHLYLANTRYKVISALSAEEAMKIMLTDLPDIVITDAMMPGESGFSLISRMKSHSQLAEIPVILWTMLEEPNGSVMDSSHLADIKISKPIYTADIMGSLKRAAELVEFRKSIRSDVVEADSTR